MHRLISFFIMLLLTANCLALQKNVASQKWVVFAFDETDNTAKTGDAAQITANLRIDGAAADAVDDTNPTELEDGYYVFDITANESNGDSIVICPDSTTANIQVIGCPMAVWTTPAYFPTMSIDSNGRLDIIKVAGTTQTANDMSGDIDAILIDTGTTLDDLIDTEVAAILTDTGTTLENHLTDIKGTGFAKDTHSLTDIRSETNAILADTGTDGVIVASIATDAISADALKTDAVTEFWAIAMTDMAAAAPSATAAANVALNWLYTAWRNGYKTDGTNSEIVLYRDDGTTPLVEADIADDGTDFTRQEYGAPD